MKNSKGFTLVELLVTLTVAAIMMTVALPSFYQMVKKNQLETAVRNITESLHLARSEAVTKGGTATFEAAQGGWREGWNCSLSLKQDTQSCSTTGAPKGEIDLEGPQSPIIFRPNGSVTGSAQFLVSHPDIENKDRYVCISLLGRISIKKSVCSA